jgi:pimeloyl-ACP methyl ester carboxylesterase
VIVAGHELEIQTFGEETNRAPIVMLHEGVGSVAMWRDFPARLADRTARRVVAYSRYGYGRSAVLRERRTVEYMHREGEVVLPELLDALGIARAVPFGHSDGGSIALLFAARFPAACEALILEAPHVFVEPLTLASIAKARERALGGDLLARLARYHDDPARTFWGWNDIWLDPAFRSWDITAVLARISAPILAIQGEDDEYGTAAQLDAIAARVPQFDALVLDACGHSPHRSDPEAVLTAAARFLARLPENVARAR